jgi:hypothetical protein
LVLAAGFIGQFGRSFALRLIERRRRNKADSDSASSPRPLPAEIGIEKSRLEARAKIEKKRAKDEVKRAKKAGGGPSRNRSGRSG